MSVISIMVDVHMNANLICSNEPSAFAQLAMSSMDVHVFQQLLHAKSLPIWNVNTISGDATWKNGKICNALTDFLPVKACIARIIQKLTYL